MEDTQEPKCLAASSSSPKLIANIWRTPLGVILQSKHRYDFVQDDDGNFLDGGIAEYNMRFGGPETVKNWENLCVYSTDPHEKKREFFYWGTYGKNGDNLVKYVLLKDLDTDHVEAIIETQWHLPEHIKDMFIDEIEFRKGFDS